MLRRARGLGELPADLRRALRESPGRFPGGDGAGPLEYVPARANIGIANKRTVAGSVQIAPSRDKRSYLALQNQSAVNEIWYQFGVDAGLGAGFVIPPGGSDIWEVVIPVGSIYVFCAVAGQGVGIAEGVPLAADLEMQSDAAPEPGEAASAPAAPAPLLARPSGGGGGIKPLTARGAPAGFLGARLPWRTR